MTRVDWILLIAAAGLGVAAVMVARGQAQASRHPPNVSAATLVALSAVGPAPGIK